MIPSFLEIFRGKKYVVFDFTLFDCAIQCRVRLFTVTCSMESLILGLSPQKRNYLQDHFAF